MTPFSFDVETAKEMLGDAEVRMIGDQARAAAEHDNGGLSPISFKDCNSYWARVIAAMRHVVWCDAYDKRVARMIRKKAAG